MVNSSNQHASLVVAKPHKDFPLFPHASGRWAKKVKGNLVYFGSTKTDPTGTAALNRWLREKDHLLAGRKPPTPGAGVTIRNLCNHFLTSKQNAVTLGDLAQRTFDDYYQICQQIVEFFGRDTPVHHLTPEDFRAYRARVAAGGFGRTQKRKKQLSAVSLKNEVNRARVVFNYGFKSQLLSQPAAYGLEFSRPAKHLLRRARGVSGQRYCDAIELRSLLNAATIPLKAMLLLGVNCGLGNREVGMLRFTNLDLKKGWLSYPRNKTGIDRRAKLWPETIAAIKEAIAARRAPVNEDHKELVFITRTGAPWFKESSDSPIAKEFSKLAKTLDVNRPGLSFYSLRHTTETIGGGCRDQVAVNFVMGHAPSESDMSANYRHDIEDSRLEAVAEHIHRWLLPDEDIDATGDG